MAKPVITKRATKAAALTYSELDANFQNLQDATISLTGGTGGVKVTADLNGNITLVAGTNITLTGDDGAKTITINSTASGATLDTDTISVGQADSDAVTIIANDTQTNKTLVLAGRNGGVQGASINLAGDITLTPRVPSSGTPIQCNGSLLLYKIDSTARDALTAQDGMVIYNTTTNKFQGRANGSWVDLH